MGSLGVLFAIDKHLTNRLMSISRSKRVEFLKNEIEELFFLEQKGFVKLNKTWSAIQQAFSKDKNDMQAKQGEYPLNHLIFGSHVLYGDRDGENEYIITIKTPQQVQDINLALSSLTEETFKEKYFAIDKAVCGFELTNEGFDDTWRYLSLSMSFWKAAAKSDLHVIFAVDR